MKKIVVWVLRIIGAFLSAGLTYYFTKSPFLAGWAFLFPVLVLIFGNKIDAFMLTRMKWKTVIPKLIIIILGILIPIALSSIFRTIVPISVSKILIVLFIPPISILITRMPPQEEEK